MPHPYFILSKTYDYKKVVFRSKANLRYDNNTKFDFCLDARNNLLCIKKGDRTSSNNTELYVLRREKRYKRFLFRSRLPIPISNNNWSFFINKNDNDLISLLKGPNSGSDKLEVHTFDRKSKYKHRKNSSITSLNLL